MAPTAATNKTALTDPGITMAGPAPSHLLEALRLASGVRSHHPPTQSSLLPTCTPPATNYLLPELILLLHLMPTECRKPPAGCQLVNQQHVSRSAAPAAEAPDLMMHHRDRDTTGPSNSLSVRPALGHIGGCCCPCTSGASTCKPLLRSHGRQASLDVVADAWVGTGALCCPKHQVMLQHLRRAA
jgi:hypothetical protein